MWHLSIRNFRRRIQESYFSTLCSFCCKNMSANSFHANYYINVNKGVENKLMQKLLMAKSTAILLPSVFDVIHRGQWGSILECNGVCACLKSSLTTPVQEMQILCLTMKEAGALSLQFKYNLINILCFSQCTVHIRCIVNFVQKGHSGEEQISFCDRVFNLRRHKCLFICIRMKHNQVSHVCFS